MVLQYVKLNNITRVNAALFPSIDHTVGKTAKFKANSKLHLHSRFWTINVTDWVKIIPACSTPGRIFSRFMCMLLELQEATGNVYETIKILIM
jgi:hypothetical protein